MYIMELHQQCDTWQGYIMRLKNYILRTSSKQPQKSCEMPQYFTGFTPSLSLFCLSNLLLGITNSLDRVVRKIARDCQSNASNLSLKRLQGTQSANFGNISWITIVAFNKRRYLPISNSCSLKFDWSFALSSRLTWLWYLEGSNTSNCLALFVKWMQLSNYNYIEFKNIRYWSALTLTGI